MEEERALSVERPMGLGTAPVAVSVTRDGRRLIVSNSGEDAVAIFALPGMGELTLKSAYISDVPMVLGTVLYWVIIVLFVGYYILKIPYDDLMGVASGATGNPSILVYSTRMAPTERPDIGYAMIFPSMTIVKVIAVQIVGLMAAGGP